MDNKLSELSKPEQFDAVVEIHGGEPFAVWAPAVNGSHVKAELYFALLAELEVKDKRISELEAKLAAPIKIVNYDEFFICHVTGASDDYCKGWVDGRNAAARDVGKAGFTVGDE